MSDSEVEVRFGADASGVKEGAEQAKESIGGIAESANDLKENIEMLAEAFVAVFAVDKLEEFTEHMAELGAQIEHTSAITGLSTDQVQQFNNLVTGTGGSIDTASVALTRLNRNISEAASGQLPLAVDAFQRLGVSQKELENGNLNEIMQTMANTLHNTADGANKTQAMYAAVGRSGAQLIPIFDLGAEGMARWNALMQETGANMGSDLSDNLERLDQALVLNRASSQGVANSFMTVLLPSINAAVIGITQMREEFSQSIASGGLLADIISGLGDVLDGVVAAIKTLVATFQSLWEIGRGTINALVDITIGWGKAIYDVAHGKLGAAIADFGTWGKKATDDFNKGLSDADATAAKLAKDLKAMMDASLGKKVGIGAGKGNKDNPFSPPETKDTSKDDESQQRQLLAEKYDTKKEYDALEVQSGQMSHQQEFADLQKALADEQALVDESFNRQMAQYDEDSAEYQKLQDQKQLADMKFNIEHMKLDLELQKEDAKTWTEVTNIINKSFDSMLTGVLQGTQTIGEAFQKMAQNMVIAFIEAVAKMLVQWAAFQAATALGIPGIKNPFGESGFIGGLLSFDVGTPYVPNDMVAQIHQGERIIPAEQNAAINRGEASIGGGGGSHAHFHFHGDSQSMQSLMKRNSGAIAKGVAAAARGNSGALRSAMRRM
jgi:hypothetical protein